MKYVKIFDSQMRPLGVLQLGAELAQSEETKYVKVYDENLDKCNGVVALSDNISEADAAKNIKIYDANLILIGGSTVGEIGGGSSEPFFKLVNKDGDEFVARYDGKIAFALYNGNAKFVFEYKDIQGDYAFTPKQFTDEELMEEPIHTWSQGGPQNFTYEGYTFTFKEGDDRYSISPVIEE